MSSEGTSSGESVRLDSIEDAIAAIARGEAIIAVDDEGRENEGDLIFAAEKATTEMTAFMIRHTSGYICVGMTGDDLDRLQLPPMTAVNEDRKGTAYSVSVDARDVTATGISAEDRSITICALGSARTSPQDLTRPGHVMPLRAAVGGVLQRPGHTEAAVDLAALAGLHPAGALCEMVHDDGRMMDAADCREFADEHGLLLISIADLIRYRLRSEKHVERVVETRLPTEFGDFTAVGFRSLLDGSEHAAIIAGEIGEGDDLLVRVHVECLAGDALRSHSCSCGPRLRESLRRIADEGRGVVLYLRPITDKGRPIDRHGPSAGAPDPMSYGLGSQILADLGVRSMRLMTASPDRRYAVDGFGLEISEVIPLA
ncbi:MAG: 3,4-dihydroxy-2-butanone-4-phosphate synthase [Actinomycetales bacterium mxb001]|nr:MAG: 3,4-dihydroxy-2-butanone-4-phosphate synthase [Actinomycetales bacterium mxb001]